MEGDTDNTPYGLGTYASRSTPVGGAATAVVARKLRDKARKLAAHLLEAAEEDLEWEPGRFFVKGAHDRGVTIQDVAFAAYTNFPEGMEPGLEGVHYYDPPNMTYPFGSYIVVVEVDAGTGQWKVLRIDRGRRLRGPDQPDDRRGPDPRRPHRRLRHGEHAVHHLRRGRQLHRLELHGLPHPDGLGDARASSSARRSPPRRTTRSGRRASASPRRSARRPPT